MSARELKEKRHRPVWNKKPENMSAQELRYYKKAKRL